MGPTPPIQVSRPHPTAVRCLVLRFQMAMLFATACPASCFAALSSVTAHTTSKPNLQAHLFFDASTSCLFELRVYARLYKCDCLMHTYNAGILFLAKNTVSTCFALLRGVSLPPLDLLYLAIEPPKSSSRYVQHKLGKVPPDISHIS